MTTGRFDLVERLPTAEEYQALRRAVGWAEVEDEAVERGLSNGLFSICVTHQGNVVGCGRVVGDGGIYFYVQDVMVLPAYQRQGLGLRIMDAIMAYISAHAGSNSFIGLMAANGVAPFYYRYGFAERPPNRPGMFRMWQKQERR